MFDKFRLTSVLKDYKKALASGWWGDEQFKWEAIKCFQDNWDINASDFSEMIARALGKTSNLLASANNFPLRMILKFAEAVPEEVRAMFAELFDESSDAVQRIENFKMQSTILLEKYGNGAAQHYQYENAISTYLWLRYPDKYYIYKLSEVENVAKFLETDYVFKRGSYDRNMRNFYRFYDEINAALKEDDELSEILKSKLTPDCYPDPELKTLTLDVGFYISRMCAQSDHEGGSDPEWFGLDYDPGLTVDDWSRLLRDPAVFTRNALEIMKRMKDYGGMATCTQLAQKYGENKNFYNSGSVGLARRVCDAAGIEPNTREDGSTQWWTVLYVGRSADEDETGGFVWKLRDELSKALDGFDLSRIKLCAVADNKVRYWLCAPGRGARLWDECVSDGIIAIGWDEIGDFRQYHSKAEIAEKLNEVLEPDKNYSSTAKALFEFSTVMKPGDIVFAKNGLYSVLGRGVVEGDYEYDPARDGLKNIRRVRWTDIAEYPYPGTAPQKTLTEITDKDLLNKLNALYDNRTEPAVSGESSGYWWLNANPKIWSFSDIAVGEVQSYTLYNENGNKRRIFQNFLDAKAGDMIIGYESNPVKQIVALGKITKEQDGEKLCFEKVEGLTSPIDYAALKDCPELENMEYFKNPQGSLFRLTKDEYDFIMELIRAENPLETKTSVEKYTESDFLGEVYMSKDKYEDLVGILENKKNIILQGAPGVGKTFAAKRLAWSVMGEKDDTRIEQVQFHQNYSYEDFVMGYKPVENGFELKYGVFYRFCQKAANRPDKDFFFIIDEINRGNMSKIFGELLMLIENDYRGSKLTLAYNGLPFSVPKNLYIVGMMNTADRSLAMIDYALRRRFSFFEMTPGFDSEGFKNYQNSLNSDMFNDLIQKIKELNREISLDKSLGKGFCIGHSYFCGRESCTEDWLRSVVNYDIIPMLSEYWFDDAAKLQRWENILKGTVND